jgi:hypothetical protein
VGEDNLKVYIAENYNKLFGTPVPNNFSLMEEYTSDIMQLSLEENGILTSEFFENEVFEAISMMEHNKGSRPRWVPDGVL